jgi:SAM-dependent methyltransferase
MNNFGQETPLTSARVREHFQRTASSFDRVYDEQRVLQRFLRPAIFRRARLAAAAVTARSGATVLDVGCGSGRIGELVLEAGASAYVGVDFSGPMLELAASRLSRFRSQVELVDSDFLCAKIERTFDVVLALGIFDYTDTPEPIVRRMRELCADVAIASFPRWNWLKGPIRRFRYQTLNDCPIFDYTEPELRAIFARSAFSSQTFLERGWSDLVIDARP